MERLAARVGEAVGAEVELERPKDPAHGDFATNVAMRSAKAVGRPPRELAQELAEKVVALDEIDSAEVAGPGFLNLRVGDRFFLDALAEIGDGLRRGVGGAARARPGRDGLGEPDRADRRLGGAQRRATATASRGCSSSRATRSRASTTTTTPAAQVDLFRASVEALRRGEDVPEDGYKGEYVVELAQREGDPDSAHARVDRAVDGALPHPLRQLGAAERARAAPAGVHAAPRHLREGRRGVGAVVRLRRRAGLGDHPLRGEGRNADLPRR